MRVKWSGRWTARIGNGNQTSRLMRIVGRQNRSEIELDPVKAYQRGRKLDAMLRAAAPKSPRGVQRGTHQMFERLDETRMLEAARKLNRR